MALDRYAIGTGSGTPCTCGGGPPCDQTFQVVTCSTNVTLSGASVGVYDHSGGTLLASGTTDSSGNVYLSWTGTNPFFIAAACSVFSYGSLLTLTCGGNKTLACLNPIHVTDSNGSQVLTWNGSVWAPSTCLNGASGPHYLSVAGVCTLSAAQAAEYQYHARCFNDPTGGAYSLEIYRTWNSYFNGTTNYYATTCTVPSCLLNSNQSAVYFHFSAINCSTPTLSGTPVAAGSNVMADPASGAITASS